jgi:hypothetical protein
VFATEFYGRCGLLQLGEPLFQFLGFDRFDSHLDRVDEHLGHLDVYCAFGDAVGDPLDRKAAVGWGAESRELDADGPGFPRRVGCASAGALENEPCRGDVALERQARQPADDCGGVFRTDCVFEGASQFRRGALRATGTPRVAGGETTVPVAWRSRECVQAETS